jgi:formylglycine-generating enzyme required for sulfatase activity
MVYVDTSSGGICIDKYEASPGEICPQKDPRSILDTQANIDFSECSPVSVPDVNPWTNVPQHQAELLCARVGKRLPSNGEWYRAAMGTPDRVEGGCVIGKTGISRADATGEERCVSSAGAEDMVGNVWEWVSETVEEGMYDSRQLPPEGYVSEVAADGVPSKTSPVPDLAFGSDQFFLDSGGVRGMMRGGFWGMSEKAGVYTVNAAVAPTFTGDAIGFRCASSPRG